MKNKVQFLKGYSLGEFMKNYGSEDKCRKTLFQWRRPQGLFALSVVGKAIAPENTADLSVQSLSSSTLPH